MLKCNIVTAYFIEYQDIDDFVIHCVTSLSTGVRLDESGDSLGQQYISPSSAIRDLHTDIIIVGRGIITADNPIATAEQYQQSGYRAYQELLS